MTYRSSRGLTNAVVVLLGLQVGAVLSSMLCVLTVRAGLQAVSDDGEPSPLVPFADNLIEPLDTAERILFVATAVVFLCWLYRCYRNLPSLGSASLNTPGSAVGGWFIPIRNLAHGHRSLHHLWMESQPGAVLPSGLTLPRRAPLIGWWWGSYLAYGFLLRGLNSFYGREPKTFDDWKAKALGLIFLWAIEILAAVLCALVVWRIYRRQQEHHEDIVRRATPFVAEPDRAL